MKESDSADITFDMSDSMLNQAAEEWRALLPGVVALEPHLLRLGQAMLDCWSRRGKVMTCGNGGSASDAMHLAEELVVRFRKNRRALAAMALCDPTAITCAGNDFGFDTIFSRQVEAFGNPGDMLVVFTTSGNSPNIEKALQAAKKLDLLTCGFLGRDGGAAKARCDIQLIVPSEYTARIQEGHKLLYHTLCQWIDQRVD
jgi:D-sedoheptulose 7-phosphate isomerase